MDTLATARKLQAAGLPPEHAQAITEAIQDGSSAVPSSLELRTFVLNINANIEQLRSEMHRAFDAFRAEIAEEFRRVHTRIDRLDERLLVHERALLTTARLVGLTAGLALAVSLFALLR